ncbi:leucine-rich repeat-containing protein 42-like [Antedon mediterranea]|uniref:leucine-rich repeat-containing protein 42-like n=1 Tax=Antedon mediterranea TaxID=105859 RepID=UPI003AF749BE
MSSSPETLLDICIDFVARNVKDVESFECIPDIIGKQIFTRATELQKSKTVFSFCNKTLKSFVSCYGTDLLTSLSLVNQKDIVNEYAEKLEVLLHCEGLVSLDLENCALDDDHIILRIVARLKRLKHLGLSHNLIGESGLRSLTTPARMMHDGPVELTTLQLAGNLQITDSCIRYLLTFKNIKFLDLSDNLISNNGLKSVCGTLNLTTMKEDRQFVEIKTSGWASTMIHNWLEEVPEPTSQAKQFYGQLTSKRTCVKKSALQGARKMRLISLDFVKKDKLTNLSNNKIEHEQRAEKHCENTDVDGDSRVRKRRKLKGTKEYYKCGNKTNDYLKGQDKKGVENLPSKVQMKKTNFRGNKLLFALDHVQNESGSIDSTLFNQGSDLHADICENDLKPFDENIETSQLKPLPIKKFIRKKKVK